MSKIQGGKSFEAVDAVNVDNNSIFLDNSDMKIKQKDNSGSVAVVGSSSKILQLYNGSDYDSSISDTSSGSDENSYELSPILSTDLTNSNYLKIKLFGKSVIQPYASGSSLCYVKIELKEIGGTYTTVLDYTATITGDSKDADTRIEIVKNGTIEWYHELTSSQKNNGVQIKVTSKSEVSGDSTSYSNYTNKQTIIEVI